MQKKRTSWFLRLALAAALPILFYAVLASLHAGRDALATFIPQTGVSAQLVSMDQYGIETGLSSTNAAVSAYGAYSAYILSDGNIYKRETATGQVSVASFTQSGGPMNDYCYSTKISDDGRFVAFDSYASNVVYGDDNDVTDVFLTDTQNGTVTRVSTDSGGAQANGHSWLSDMSPDGRYIVFYSGATNLVPGNVDGCTGLSCWDVYVKDMSTGQVTAVSTDSSGNLANNSERGSISSDGRYVAFKSEATNLVSGDDNGVADVFVRDTATGETSRVSTDTAGTQANGVSGNPHMARSGIAVVFSSTASNLVAGDTNGDWDSFVKDLETGVTRRASTTSSGLQLGDGSSMDTWISSDGKNVGFWSMTSDVVPGSSPGNAYIKDLTTGHVDRLSTDTSGAEMGGSGAMVMSDDGHFVLFPSAKGLVPGSSYPYLMMFLATNGPDAAAVSNLSPSGWLTTTDITVAGDMSGMGSGFRSFKAKLDGDEIAGCSITASDFSCPVSGLSQGPHQISVEAVNNLGFLGYQAQDIPVDSVAPTVIISAPTEDVISANQEVLDAAAAEYGSGLQSGSITAYVDGSPLTNCGTQGNNSIFCRLSGISEGPHDIEVRAVDLAGNIGSTSRTYTVDNTGPSVTNPSPAQVVYQADYTIGADISDPAGIDVPRTEVFVNNENVSNSATVTSSHISYSGKSYGKVHVYLQVFDAAGNSTPYAWDFYAPPRYYFTWNDNKYGSTWTLAANPIGWPMRNFDVSLSSQLLEQNIVVPGGSTFTKRYGENEAKGPLTVATHLPAPALVSERSLYGNSFEEIWATSFDDLDNSYWWPIYDDASMSDWVLVSNPAENEENVTATVVVNQVIQNPHGLSNVVTKSLAPGETWTPAFAGMVGRGVSVWAQGDTTGLARKVNASQRVLYRGAFNEMPGVARSQWSSAYIWTWYDNKSPGAQNWICITNPYGPAANVMVVVGDYLIYDNQDPDCQCGPIAGGDTLILKVPPDHPAAIGGPVIVVSCGDPQCNTEGQKLVASQRVIWGSSFSEIAGTPYFTDNSNWTWYDQATPGAANWVLISNPDSSSMYAEMTIGNDSTPVWSGTVQPYSNVTPQFPNVIGGPVSVRAWAYKGGPPKPVFASQRVLWNGYFNEIVGKGL